MLHVDLSSLRGPELRRLLDATRERGQAQLSYEILQEMAARRERGGKPSPEPRVVEMNFGDPLEVDEDVYEEQEELLDDEGEEPLSLAARAAPNGAHAPDDAPPLRMAREPTVSQPPPRSRAGSGEGSGSRGAFWPLLTFAVGITLGAGLGWWAGGVASRAPAPRISPDLTPPPANFAETAPAIPAEPPPAPAAPIPEGAAPPAAGEANVAPEGLANPPAAAPAAAAPTTTTTTTTALAAAPPPAPAPSVRATGSPAAQAAEAAQLTPVAPAVPKRPARPATPPAPVAVASSRPAHEAAAETRAEAKAVASDAEPLHIAAAGPGGCAAQPTPADRTICADPRLQRLQHDLRRAYAEALVAHQDKATLRERQMAWKDARDGVATPEKLTRLYEERIKKLEAATAEARREQH